MSANTGLATNIWVVLVALAERIHLSTCPPSQAVHPSVRPSAHPSLHPPTRLHFHLLIRPPTLPSTHTHPSTHPPTLPPTHPSTHPPSSLLCICPNKTLLRATLCQALGQVLEIQQQSKHGLCLRDFLFLQTEMFIDLFFKTNMFFQFCLEK